MIRLFANGGPRLEVDLESQKSELQFVTHTPPSICGLDSHDVLPPNLSSAWNILRYRQVNMNESAPRRLAWRRTKPKGLRIDRASSFDHESKKIVRGLWQQNSRSLRKVPRSRQGS